MKNLERDVLLVLLEQELDSLEEAKAMKNMTDEELKSQHDEINKKIKEKGGVSANHPLSQKARTIRTVLAMRKTGKKMNEALHPNQQKIDVVDDDKIDGKDFAKLRAMKNKKTGKIHNCAVHVEHSDYGIGQCISEAHADPDEDGNIEWYTAKFEEGTFVVFTNDIKVLEEKSHMHEAMDKNMAYATGTKKAMQMTGDKPPLEKATIKKGHEIAKAMLRKEEAEETNEAQTSAAARYAKAKMSSQAKTTMKHVANPTAGEMQAAKDIKPGIAGYRDRIAVLQSAKTRGSLKNEEAEHFEDYDEVVEGKPLEFDLQDSYNFGDYLTTAKKLVGGDQAIELANISFNKQDTSLFVEEMTRDEVESRVKTHMNAGHEVSTPKYSTRDGKFHAEFVVKDKESGVRRKYIYHGNTRKMENMGTPGKRD